MDANVNTFFIIFFIFFLLPKWGLDVCINLFFTMAKTKEDTVLVKIDTRKCRPVSVNGRTFPDIKAAADEIRRISGNEAYWKIIPPAGSGRRGSVWGAGSRMINRKELFQKNKGLAYYFVKGYRRLPDYDDILQCALIGLWQAACRYDSGYGALFSSYARYYILGRIGDFFRGENRQLKTVSVAVSSEGEETDIYEVIPDSRYEPSFQILDDMELEAEAKRIECPRRRNVFLFHLRGKSFKEIGADLDISKQAAWQLFYKAVQDLTGLPS